MSLDRRTFLTRLSLALGGIAAGMAACKLFRGGPPVGQFAATDEAEAAQAGNLVWVEGKDPYANTVRAVKELGGIERFLKKGQRVTILPNVGWARKPEFAATTNPQVVRALVDMCQQAGAKSISLFCNPCNDMRMSLDLSGIGDVIHSTAARYEFINEDGWNEHTAVPGCTHLKKADVYRLIDNCDLLINCPIAKHHGSSQLTMCCKNLMGAVRDRGAIHQSLHEGIADLTMMIPAKLCVLDATRILLRNGPTGGNLKDVKVCNTIIAGTNAAEVDVLGCGLFGSAPKDIGFLKLLGDRGYVKLDPAKLAVQRVKA